MTATAGIAQGGLTLIVRRTIRAPAERLFAAWTDPAALAAWWGPGDIRCAGASVDLRVGGRYRIGNRFPDGRLLWIVGTFERIDPPHVLIFSWGIEPAAAPEERVTVRFDGDADTTEVIVTHERIADATLRAGHERGWVGCLEGLGAFAESSGAR